MKEKNQISDVDWIHYLTRPFDIFVCSIWYKWYAEYAQRLVKEDISDMLSVEETENVVRNYRSGQQLQHLKDSVQKLALDKREDCLNMLRKAEGLNEEAEKYLSDPLNSFTDIEKAVEFLLSLALNATILPHFVAEGLQAAHKEDKELMKLCEELRSKSLYPIVLKKIIVPMAQKMLEDCKIENPEEAVRLITFDELIARDFSHLEERKKQRNLKKKFIYKVVDKNQSIEWVDETLSIINSIEKIQKEENITGQSTYPGKVVGKARIIRSYDPSNFAFDEGDILVSINSNPNLMPLIKKAGALVTDEGGVTCHAAIVSRELKIPCVIGTKIATKVLKDGNKVEVNANEGVVKII